MYALIPWIFIGGCIFILLSFIGSRVANKPYKTTQYLQDFISGSIVITFISVLMPDILPVIEMPSLPQLSSGGSSLYDNGDVELQVGPPRLMGK
jgi:hypothetical protein